MRTRKVPAAVLSVLLTLGIVVIAAPPAFAAVTISRAELSGSRLRIEGRATASRTITVDGVAMGTSSSSGEVRIERDPFTPPADCTVDVNDGSSSPAVARLSGCTVASTPPPPPPPPPSVAAPTLLAPDNGASVTVPFTISWSAVSHASGIAGYNWRVATTSTFSPSVRADSTNGSTTQATIGGLPNGTYFWSVQTVTNSAEASAWAPPRSFTITGVGEGHLAAPTLSLVHGNSFHPWESFGFRWTAVDGAAIYFLEWSREPDFLVGSTNKIDNIEGLRTGMLIGDFCGGCEQGTYFARVYGLDANRVSGARSNVVSWTISYNAPLAPPPTPLSPTGGPQLTLPIELDWTDAPNPQSSGYEIQISRNASFTDIEEFAPQLNNSRRLVLSLTSGTKFWRVRHGQGMMSPTLPAYTAWSAPASFTIPNEAPRVQSVWLGGPPCEDPCPGADTLASGQEIVGSIQLTTAAPAGGAVVRLTGSGPATGTFPDTVTVPAGHAFAGFRLFAGTVTEVTPATLTATLGTSSDDFPMIVSPASLRHIMFGSNVTGGAPAAASIQLRGLAPPGGATFTLSSNSPLLVPPATGTVPAGFSSTTVSIPTREVTTATQATLFATMGGVTVEATVMLRPSHPVASIELDRTSATGTEGASGVVRLQQPGPGFDVDVRLTSSHPNIARVPDWVNHGAFAGGAGFLVQTNPTSVPTTVTISATSGGVTRTTTLTVAPTGGLSSVTVSPSSVTGGASSSGTVSLQSAAPTGGAAVALSSSNSAVTVPASVTVPAGLTSATFSITTTTVTTNVSATISATRAGVTQTATLTVNGASSATDTVSIRLAEYDGRRLRVEATSSSAGVTLRVYVTATNALIGTLSGGRGEFSVAANPQSITVRSSGGGSATRTVTAK